MIPGTGVAANVLAVLAGTVVGLLFGGLISDRLRRTAFTAIGLSIIVIGGGMAIGGLTDLGRSHIGEFAPLVLVVSLVLGGLTGEALGIEAALERFGSRLQSVAHRLPLLEPAPEGEAGEGHTLVEGFVTASLIFCVGAMTVLGSIQDGLGDPSTLYLKSTLDGVTSIALASTLGVGVGLSIIPVAIIQGGFALGAHALQPLITSSVIAALQASGGALILAIGFDLAGIRRLPVGNLLPELLYAATLAWWLG